jgi:6-phosphogluconate dehydrogenase
VQLGMVGLGRMGGNMTQRLIEHGHEVVAFDRNADTVAAAESEGAIGALQLADLVAKLTPPRAVWIMVPSGEPTRATIDELLELLDPGDTIVDGGNSRYTDAVAHAARLQGRGIAFVDAGVSGGVWGLKNGYCLMVGGPDDAVTRLEPIFRALAPEDGYAHVGPSGAGHYTKMVHNGIEYGMLQSYAEGFALLDAAEEFSLDLHEISALWNHGSVVQSWLLELAEMALDPKAGFTTVKGYVEDSGEGRWTVEEGVRRAVPTPAIAASLYARFASRDDERFAARIVAALRNQFGGHRFFTESAAAETAKAAAGEAEGGAGPEAAASDRDG